MHHTGSCRRIVQALQQLWPEKFKCFEKHDQRESENGCFQLTVAEIVHKALDESNLAKDYAIVCKEISELFQAVHLDASTNTFKAALNNYMQKIFNSIRKTPSIYKNLDEVTKLKDKINFEKDQQERTHNIKVHLEVLAKSRDRATGSVKFIAELYNVDFMTNRIMQFCMRDLLHPTLQPSELDVECFHMLITTIGEKFESDPAGVAVVEKFLRRLEEVMDYCRINFCMRVRYLLLDIFEKRANHWINDEEFPDPQKKKTEISRALPKAVFEESRFIGTFLRNLKQDLLCLKNSALLDFIKRFKNCEMISEEQLEGSVNIIFEHAISLDQKNFISIICKGLADVNLSTKTSKDTDRKTFANFLILLCSSEIYSQRQNTSNFQKLSQKARGLMERKGNNEGDHLKAVLKRDLKIAQRAFQVADLFGELYKVEILDNRFIYDYFNALLAQENISNTSIECFCRTLKVAGTLLVVRNLDGILNGCFKKLQESAKTFKTSPKVQNKFENAALFCNTGMGLNVPFEDFKASKIYRNMNTWPCKNHSIALWTSRAMNTSRLNSNIMLSSKLSPYNVMRHLLPSEAFRLNGSSLNEVAETLNSTSERAFADENNNSGSIGVHNV